MNTIELTSILRKKIINGTDFIGTLACDQLTEIKVCNFPSMLIANTQPSTMPGEHWVAVYITKHKDGYFFDSFGNPPDYVDFPAEFNNFLKKNCVNVCYSSRQVQNFDSTTCGQHCVFFLCQIQKGMSYAKMINMYGDNLNFNDVMVSHFVNKIKPCVCRGYNFTCVQHGKRIL